MHATESLGLRPLAGYGKLPGSRPMLVTVAITALAVTALVLLSESLRDLALPELAPPSHKLSTALVSLLFTAAGACVIVVRYRRHYRLFEAAVRQSEERFNSLTLASNDWVWEVDAAGAYTRATPPLHELTGHGPDEVLGKRCYTGSTTLQPGEHLAAVLDAHFRRRETIRRVEAILPRRDGSQVVVETSAIPLFDDRGAFCGYCGIDHDITDRKEALQALERSQRELAIINRIGAIFLSVPSVEMYGDVLNCVVEALKSQYGTFGYIDDDGSFVIPSITREVWSQCQIRDKEYCFPRAQWGQSLWARTILAGSTILSNSPGGVPEGHLPIYRSLNVPILHQDRTIGLFQVANKATDYDARDQELLEAIARHIAPALHERLLKEREEHKRQQAEQALAASARRLQQVIDGSNDGIWDLDLRAGVVHQSRRTAEMLGYEPNEFPAREEEYLKLVHPDDVRRRARALEDHLEGRAERYECEFRLRAKRGGWKWVLGRGKIVERDEDGRPARVAGTNSDIDARKQMEAEREHLASFPQLNPGPVVEVDVHGHLRFSNPAARSVLRGLGREDPRDFLPAGVAELRAAIYAAGHQAIHRRVVILDRVFDELVCLAPGYDTVRVYASDVTERTRAEEAQRAASLYARSLIEASLDPLVTISRTGQIMDVNQATEFATGVSREQLIGSDFANYFTQPEKASAGYQEALDRGFVREYPLAIRHVSGAIMDVVYNATVFRDEAGQVQGVFAAARDVTARRRIEAEREALIAELETKNAQLEQFVYTASHELKTPLVSINGLLGLLDQDLDRGNLANAKARIARVSNASQKLYDLVQGLLELSRAGRAIESPAELSLGEIAAEAAQMVGAEMTDGHLSDQAPKPRIAADLPPVWGDRTRLVGLLRNLLENAVKYIGNQPDPQIEVGWRRGADETVYYVRDNGAGIEPKFHERVFKLFEQLDPAREGSGVGLTIARRIVEMHGGQLWVESEGPGKGAAFCFTLPGKRHDAG